MSRYGAEYDKLIGETIAAVYVTEDKDRLVFRLETPGDGPSRTLTYQAEGDCCSSTWIEHVTVPDDIAGTMITLVRELEMPEGEENKDYEFIQVYQTAFSTPKGEIIVEYRNSSNGYYGGSLVGPLELA